MKAKEYAARFRTCCEAAGIELSAEWLADHPHHNEHMNFILGTMIREFFQEWLGVVKARHIGSAGAIASAYRELQQKWDALRECTRFADGTYLVRTSGMENLIRKDFPDLWDCISVATMASKREKGLPQDLVTGHGFMLH